MKQDNALQVYYDEKLVGTLAMTANRKAAFQYSDEWLEHGFSISPFSLPLKKQVFVPTKDYFGGLYGVFADSLPDNWGRLLLNRLLREHKQDLDKLTVLDRLAIVGKSGMGALTYYPGRKELLAVGITAGMKKSRCMEIIDEIEKCVGEMFGNYL